MDENSSQEHRNGQCKSESLYFQSSVLYGRPLALLRGTETRRNERIERKSRKSTIVIRQSSCLPSS
jgi:hypothetical protein